jgi:ATP-dependent Lon protease
VAFDEFAGKNKKADKALVDIMKNYMANKSFSRGVESIGAEASMVFVGNTRHTLPYMLKHTDLFDELPPQYYDSAFLDRLHFYLPGWEVDIIRGEMFSDGYGFVVDYLAEILRTFRNHDFSHQYQGRFDLLSDISTRDRDSINKTFSGMMKVLYPHGEATESEVQEVLRFAIEGRKRIKMQLMRIDPTYAKVRFGYTANGDEHLVRTLEEKQYPQYFEAEKTDEKDLESPREEVERPVKDALPEELKEQHLIFEENQRGICFDTLLGPYLKGAGKITITDPYIRLFFQARNLMELLETIGKQKADEDEVAVHLITVKDEFKGPQQIDYFEKMKESCAPIGIDFTWEFDETNSIHARHIVTDHGWKILLDRGLDIFQHYEMNDAFAVANRLQRYRSCKSFEITYMRKNIDGNS